MAQQHFAYERLNLKVELLILRISSFRISIEPENGLEILRYYGTLVEAKPR
jgi:hypothetical protein